MIAVLDGQHFEKALYCSCLMEKEDSTQPDVILARRSSDGYLTFDLKISHLIEQTLRRALNKPGFRKSTIKILEEGEEDPGIGSKAATAIIQSASSPPTPASSYSPKSLVPVKRTYSDSSLYTPCKNNSILPHSSSTQSSDIAVKVRKYNESPTKEAELFIKRLCERTETDAVKFEGVSSIPIEWIERGITAKDREQFERSIANASLCPHDQIGRLARVQKYAVPNFVSSNQNSLLDEEVSVGSDVTDDPFDDPDDLPSFSSANRNSNQTASTASAPQLYIPANCRHMSRSVGESVTESDTATASVSSYYSLPDDMSEQVPLSLSDDDSFTNSISEHIINDFIS